MFVSPNIKFETFKKRIDEIMGDAGKDKCEVIVGDLNAMSLSLAS